MKTVLSLADENNAIANRGMKTKTVWAILLSQGIRAESSLVSFLIPDPLAGFKGLLIHATGSYVRFRSMGWNGKTIDIPIERFMRGTYKVENPD